MDKDVSRFWEYVKDVHRQTGKILQNHYMGKETTVQEEAMLEKLYTQYSLFES